MLHYQHHIALGVSLWRTLFSFRHQEASNSETQAVQMATATSDGEKKTAEESLAKQVNSMVCRAMLSCCFLGFVLVLFLFLTGVLVAVILRHIKCRTLLPATCQITGTKKNPFNLTVTPENGDMPFSFQTQMPSHLVDGKKVQCFYCNRYFNILQFDSDRKKSSSLLIGIPVGLFILSVILCARCCCCVIRTRQGGGKRDTKPKVTNMNTSKKSESGTTKHGEGEYQDSTTICRNQHTVVEV